jgi:hypothetical protein
MTTLRQAAEPEQWKTCRHCGFYYKPPKTDKWFPLEQTEQEPVAWQWCRSGHFRKKIPKTAYPEDWRPLYTAPQQRQWVGLTEFEIIKCFGLVDWFDPQHDVVEFSNGEILEIAKAIEAKLKEKNHDRT